MQGATDTGRTQQEGNNQNNTNIAQVAQLAFQQHEVYREKALRHRRFKHEAIVPLLEGLKKNPLFEVAVAGASVEGRSIYMVKAGTGKTKVMLWSQMHGDEPTATMALFDLLNFLQQSDLLDAVRQRLLQETTLYLVPMLNPDGAERFKRRNALDIDLNRDALHLQSPEARLLKSLRDSLNPDFGFNLHDQSRYYAAGATPAPTAIAFLAPAFDYAKTVNPVRERAMRTIAAMNEALQALIPGQVAKFSDEHEPRAFGDNIQKWGTSVILLESGGYVGDREKQHIRRLNFAAIVSALHLISEEGYKHHKIEDYYAIPENRLNFFDLVLRNVRAQQFGQEVQVDIGIMREEGSALNEMGFYSRSSVQEIGDMRVYYGYEELQAEGLTLVAGKVYEKPFKAIAALSPVRVLELLEEGYTTVRLKELPAVESNPVEFPLNLTDSTKEVTHELGIGLGANFVLQETDGSVRYAIVNGFVYDLKGERPAVFHGLIL